MRFYIFYDINSIFFVIIVIIFYNCHYILSFFLYYLTYIESKFESWMTWENYGKYNGTINYGWDIDHILPLSIAQTEEEIFKLNHFTNLRPLCSYTNRHVKSDKIDKNCNLV